MLILLLLSTIVVGVVVVVVAVAAAAVAVADVVAVVIVAAHPTLVVVVLCCSHPPNPCWCSPTSHRAGGLVGRPAGIVAVIILVVDVVLFVFLFWFVLERFETLAGACKINKSSKSSRRNKDCRNRKTVIVEEELLVALTLLRLLRLLFN